MSAYESEFRRLLGAAGIALGGAQPWDIQVHDQRAYRRCLAGGAIGLGESYMDGCWDSVALDQSFERILQSGIRDQMRLQPGLLLAAAAEQLPNLGYVIPGMRPLVARFQNIWATAETHYDVGNEFYRRLLDPNMIYSCGYWAEATSLPEAQLAKLELACRKLQLEPGMRVLDIGCGWGSFAKYAAETHGACVVGVTISREQQQLAQERCAHLPVEIRLMDYRDIAGGFDRIVSFGMFEHVGRANFRRYLEIAHRSLEADGLMLLETIGADRSGLACNPWFQKYIFQAPTSMFPSISELSRAAEGLFVIEDWHNFGADYAPTLRGWDARLEQSRDWIVANYSERFFRMWRFYLLSCAGAFAARAYQMWQIVLSPGGVPGGYRFQR